MQPSFTQPAEAPKKMNVHQGSPMKKPAFHNIKSLRSSYKYGQQSPAQLVPGPSRKPVARAVANAPAIAPPLTSEISDWRETPFFKQIQKDRLEQNIVLGRKFNLNLEEGKEVFHETEEHQQEIRDGVRRHIKWEPIEKLRITKCNSDEVIQKQQESIQSGHQFLVATNAYRLVSQSVLTVDQNSPDSAEQSHEAMLMRHQQQRERAESQHSNTIFAMKKSITNNAPRFTNITGDTRLTTGGDNSEGNQNTDRYSKEDSQPFQHFTHSILSDSVVNATTEAETTNAHEIILTERSQAGQNSALLGQLASSVLHDPPKLKKVEKKLVKAQPQPRSGDKSLQQFLHPRPTALQALPDRVKEAVKLNELASKGPNRFISLHKEAKNPVTLSEQPPRLMPSKPSARAGLQQSQVATMSAVLKSKQPPMSTTQSAINQVGPTQSFVVQDPQLSELKTPFTVRQQTESLKTLQSQVTKPENKKSQVNVEVSSDGSDLSEHHLSTVDEKLSFPDSGPHARNLEDHSPQQAYPVKYQTARGGSRRLPDDTKDFAFESLHPDSIGQQVRKKLASPSALGSAARQPAHPQHFKGYQSPKSREGRQKSNTQTGKAPLQAPLSGSYSYNPKFSKSHGHQQASFLSSFNYYNQLQMAQEKNPQPAFSNQNQIQPVANTNPELYKTHQVVRHSMAKLSLSDEEADDVERAQPHAEQPKPYIPPNFKKQQQQQDKPDNQPSLVQQITSSRKPPRKSGTKTRENSGHETKKTSAIIQNESGAFEKVNLSFSAKMSKFRKVEEPQILSNSGRKSPQMRTSELQIQNSQQPVSNKSRNKIYTTSNSQSRAVQDVQNFQPRIGMDKYSTPRSGEKKQLQHISQSSQMKKSKDAKDTTNNS